jgi:hypothetical protein
MFLRPEAYITLNFEFDVTVAWPLSVKALLYQPVPQLSLIIFARPRLFLGLLHTCRPPGSRAPGSRDRPMTRQNKYLSYHRAPELVQ